jgi:hypothetical protein
MVAGAHAGKLEGVDGASKLCDTSISRTPAEQGVHAERIMMDANILSSRARGRTKQSDRGRMIAVWH